MPVLVNPSRFASSGGGGGSGYDAAISALSPVRRWKLDDASTGSGAAAEVVAGMSGDLDATLATVSQTGLITDGGTSVATTKPASGTAYPISLPSQSGGNLNSPVAIVTNANSWVIWFKYVTTSGNNDIMFRDNSSSGGTLLNLTSTTASFRINGTDHTLTGVTSASLKSGTHMFASTTDGTNVKIYIDGSLVVSFTQTTTGSWFNYLILGKNGGVASQYTSGVFDDCAVFNSTLAATDIANIYAAR